MVRAALLEIEHVEEGERKEVIREFIQSGGLSGLAPDAMSELPAEDDEPVAESTGSDEVELRLTRSLGGKLGNTQRELDAADERLLPLGSGSPAADAAIESLEGDGMDPPRFASLRQADAGTIAALLQGEHPQTIALVLAHLPAERSAAVLGQLASSIQVPVLQRIAEIEPADPEVLYELEHQLQRLLDQQVGMSRQPSAGLSALHAILDATTGEERRSLIERLGVADRTLLQQCGGSSRTGQGRGAGQGTLSDTGRPPQPAKTSTAESLRHLEFADLGEWAVEDLATLLEAAEPAVVLLALAGADEGLMRRVLQPLAPRQARELCRRIESQGPLRLKDIQLAQQRLTLLARRLVAEGRIAPPHPPRFATAI
jgi:flagellar motor switch protein FliG